MPASLGVGGGVLALTRELDRDAFCWIRGAPDRELGFALQDHVVTERTGDVNIRQGEG